MNSFITPDILFPILLALVGLFVIVSIVFWFLRQRKILRAPFNGMEWSEILWIAIFILGVICISSSYVNPTLQTFRTFKAQQQSFAEAARTTFPYFTQYFLIVFIIIIIYTFLTLLLIRFFPGEKNVKGEIQTGNISLSILLSASVLGFAMFCYFISSNILDALTPVVINFR